MRGFLERTEARTCLVSFWSRIPFDARARELNRTLFDAWRSQARALLGTRVPDAESTGALMVGIVVGIVVQATLDDGLDVERLVDEAAARLVGA